MGIKVTLWNGWFPREVEQRRMDDPHETPFMPPNPVGLKRMTLLIINHGVAVGVMVGVFVGVGMTTSR